MNAVEVRDLSVQFGDFFAVSGLSFSVKKRGGLWLFRGQWGGEDNDDPGVVRSSSSKCGAGFCVWTGCADPVL